MAFCCQSCAARLMLGRRGAERGAARVNKVGPGTEGQEAVGEREA